jgi:TonB family protein
MGYFNRIAAITSLIGLAIVGLSARAADYEPAHRTAGDVPNPPVNAIGWVEAVVGLEVDSSGAITHATGLRATPGGLNFVLPSLKNWKFKPANDGKVSVGSQVLVAAMFRPAQLFDPAGGSPPEDLHAPPDELPYPQTFTRPGYPQKVVGNRSVLIEVLLRADGHIESATVVGPASGFDGAALTAARAWTFSPARHETKAVRGVAYLIFGFRMPVTEGN